jgi:hypothetical protein
MSLSLGMRAVKSVGEKVHFIGTAVARPAGTKVPLAAWYGHIPQKKKPRRVSPPGLFLI